MEERWKTVPGFCGNYAVSTFGRVAWTKEGNHRIRKLHCDGQGYRQVTLMAGPVRATRRVHRLVAEAFLPRAATSMTVNHKDGDKDNNRVKNLEWISMAKNLEHAVTTGLLVKACGERIHTAKLTAEKVRKIRVLLAAGRTQQSVATEFGVYKATINFIATGRSWKHV